MNNKNNIKLDTFLHIKLSRMSEKELLDWFKENNLILENGDKYELDENTNSSSND